MTTDRTDTISRRSAMVGLGVAGTGLAISVVHPATAKDGTPESSANHPIVGTWFVDFEPGNPGTQVGYASFHADGTRTDVSPFAGTGIGVWRSTGVMTGETVTKYQNIAERVGEFIPGTMTVWESFTVDEGGDRFTMVGDVEYRASDGTIVRRFTFHTPLYRLTVEPPPPIGTPESTPAS
jgi:hypothetical protein